MSYAVYKTPDIPDTNGQATPEWVRSVRTALQVLTGRRVDTNGVRGAVAGGVSLVDDVVDVLRNGNGGTGQQEYAQGDMLYALTKNVLARLALGAAGTVLVSTGTVPAWGLVPTTSLSGVLQAAQFPALTGDVTTPSGSLATSIGANKVTLPMLAQIPNATVLGNSSGITANVAALTTLPSAVQDNITRLGTITSGVWNGTAVLPVNGGTGLTGFTAGDLVYASALNTLAKLAIGTSGKVLQSTGSLPAWSTPAWPTAAPAAGTFPRGDGTNFVTSTLVLPNAMTSGGVPYGSAANTLASSAALGLNQVVIGGGAGAAPSTSANLTFNGSQLVVVAQALLAGAGSAGTAFGVVSKPGLFNSVSGGAGLMAIGASGNDYGVVGYNVDFQTTGGTYKYIASDTASLIEFNAGSVVIKTAAAGVAGAALTLTTRFTVALSGAITITTPSAFVAGDKYLVVDSTGNIHKSALGPAS